jgi:hypothetical protein
MLHVPSMEGLDGFGRRAHTPDSLATDDGDLLLLMALSVLEAAGCLQPLRNDNLPGRATSADSYFAFVLAIRDVRSWFAGRRTKPAARQHPCTF